MTKLSNMDLPIGKNRGGHGMQHCERCKEWVPSLEKHNKKRHTNEKR
jgi:hypothetical protein